jgi:hypothetical protein
MATGEFPRCATKSDFFARANSGENGMVPDVQASINGPQHGNSRPQNARLTYRRQLPKVFFLGLESPKKPEAAG